MSDSVYINKCCDRSKSAALLCQLSISTFDSIGSKHVCGVFRRNTDEMYEEVTQACRLRAFSRRYISLIKTPHNASILDEYGVFVLFVFCFVLFFISFLHTTCVGFFFLEYVSIHFYNFLYKCSINIYNIYIYIFDAPIKPFIPLAVAFIDLKIKSARAIFFISYSTE